jgi:hypothetical protein
MFKNITKGLIFHISNSSSSPNVFSYCVKQNRLTEMFLVTVNYSPIKNLHFWKFSQLFITLLVVTVLSTCVIQHAQQL